MSYRKITILFFLLTLLMVSTDLLLLTRYNKSDFDERFNQYEKSINEHQEKSFKVVSNLCMNASVLLRLNRNNNSDVSASDLIPDTVSTNSASFLLSSNNYNYVSCNGIRYAQINGHSFSVGERFFDGSIVLDFDRFYFRTTQHLYTYDF